MRFGEFTYYMYKQQICFLVQPFLHLDVLKIHLLTDCDLGEILSWAFTCRNIGNQNIFQIFSPDTVEITSHEVWNVQDKVLIVTSHINKNPNCS